MWEVVYMEIDEVGYEAAEMEVDKVADMVMKITIKDDLCDWRLVILLEMMLEVVKEMKVDKVVNEEADMVKWKLSKGRNCQGSENCQRS